MARSLLIRPEGRCPPPGLMQLSEGRPTTKFRGAMVFPQAMPPGNGHPPSPTLPRAFPRPSAAAQRPSPGPMLTREGLLTARSCRMKASPRTRSCRMKAFPRANAAAQRPSLGQCCREGLPSANASARCPPPGLMLLSEGLPPAKCRRAMAFPRAMPPGNGHSPGPTLPRASPRPNDVARRPSPGPMKTREGLLPARSCRRRRITPVNRRRTRWRWA